MNRPDLYASAFLAVFAAAAGIAAFRLGLGDLFNPGPGFMPLATAALLGLMALGQLVRVAAGRGGGGDVLGFAGSRWSAVILVLAALAGFGVALDVAGFSLATFFMLLVLFGGVARKRWWIALLSALGIVVIARLLFAALGLQFPEGPLGM